MSRMEKHRARRESIANNSNVSENKTNLEDLDFNPITNIHQEENIPKRTKHLQTSQRLVPPVTKQSFNSNQSDIFDIETAFERLRTKRRDVDYDTQLEIINDIFSDNMVEYNSTGTIYRDSITDKIMISENELLKILDDREAAVIQENDRKVLKERKLKKHFQKSEKVVKPVVEETIKPVIETKDEPIVETELELDEQIDLDKIIKHHDIEPVEIEETNPLAPVVEEPVNEPSDNRANQLQLLNNNEVDKYDFSNLEKGKGGIFLIVLVVILALVLAYLIKVYIF